MGSSKFNEVVDSYTLSCATLWFLIRFFFLFLIESIMIHFISILQNHKFDIHFQLCTFQVDIKRPLWTQSKTLHSKCKNFFFAYLTLYILLDIKLRSLKLCTPNLLTLNYRITNFVPLFQKLWDFKLWILGFWKSKVLKSQNFAHLDYNFVIWNFALQVFELYTAKFQTLYINENTFFAQCSEVCQMQNLGHSANIFLLSVILGKQRRPVVILFAECKTFGI